MNHNQTLNQPKQWGNIADDGDYYTVTDLQKCLNCNRNTIYRWIADKDLAKILKPHKEGANYFIYWRNLKKFFIAYPGEVERTHPDITWLITLLSSY